MAIINVRSPKYVPFTNALQASVTLTIKIWTGIETSPPSESDYVIIKKALNIGDTVVFEVSELIRDYIETYFNGSYSSTPVWASFGLQSFNASGGLITGYGFTNLCLDGYDYFEQSSTSQDATMITNRKLFVLKDNTLKIPINTASSPTVRYYVNNQLVSTITYLSSNDSADQVEYISILNNNKITITSLGNTETIDIDILEECKYEPKKITFINKFGALQDMIFFKKAVEKMNVNKESYKSNILSGYTYDRSNHVNRDFNLVGKESITLSSGFLSEEYNEVFKQMMLSEKVWVTNVVDNVEQVLPINVKTGDITYKTSLNDKLVQYTIEFDNSFDTINNIR